jgi:hypothetical protein
MHHVHEHHHHHHLDHELRRGRRRGEGRAPGRRGDLEARIAFLEERQRDLEQAAADIASKIQWLRDRAAKADVTPAPAEQAGGGPETTA